MSATTDWLIESTTTSPRDSAGTSRRRTAGATGSPSSRRRPSGSTRCSPTATGDPDEPLAVLQPRRGIVTRRAVAVNAVLAGCAPDVFPVVLTRGARALPAGGEPARRQRDDPSGGAARDRARRDRRARRASTPAPARSDRATAPTPPSAARCGSCCSISRARGPDPATRRRRASRRSTRTASPRTSPSRRGRATRAAAASTRRARSRSTAARTRTTSTTRKPTAIPRLILGQDRVGDDVARAATTRRSARASGSWCSAPSTRASLANAGLERRDVASYLFDHARIPAGEFRRHFSELAWAEWMKLCADDHALPMTGHPDNIRVVVVGGPGKHSSVIPSWGMTRSVTAGGGGMTRAASTAPTATSTPRSPGSPTPSPASPDAASRCSTTASRTRSLADDPRRPKRSRRAPAPR